MSKTRTIGKSPGHNDDRPAHEAINESFLEDFFPGEKITNNPTYKASEGADKMTRCGTIECFLAKLTVPTDDNVVMSYCGLLETPTLSHYMFTALFSAATSVTLRDGTKIERTTKGQRIGCFETTRFLFIEQNKNKSSKHGRLAKDGHKIMWVIRKDDNKYIGKVENGTLYRL